MNPLELTQAAADAGGRTLGEISPVYAELVDIAYGDTPSIDQGDIPTLIADIEAGILTQQEIEIARLEAQECMEAARMLAQNITDPFDNAAAHIALAKADPTVGSLTSTLEKTRAVLEADKAARLQADLTEITAESGDIPWAIHIMEGISREQRYEKARALAAIATAQASSGSVSAALDLIPSILETADDPYLAAKALAEIAKLNSNPGTHQRIRVAIDGIHANPALNIFTTLPEITRAYAVIGETAMAEEANQKHNNGYMLRDEAEIAIADADPTQENINKALGAITIVVSNFSRDLLLRKLIPVLARSGDFGLAQTLAGSISEDIDRLGACTDIATIHPTHEIIDEAVLLAGRTPESSRDKARLVPILARFGEPRQARGEAESITDPVERVRALANLSKELTAQADKSVAKTVE